MGAENGSARHGERPGHAVERVATFSDGVFAIAITLLVLPLLDADVRDGTVGRDLLDLTPNFFAFALSFAVIGRLWRVHHRAFARVVRVDGALVALSLVFLFWVALLPFPTAVLGEHGDTTAGVVLYATCTVATAFSSLLLWWYAAFGRSRLRRGARPLVRSDADPADLR
ncbi:TMEM175 family protein, partial [Saccharomonospora saliphila]|uniref:TMEM175 family protein n=1 Tax=Saccharomonospora saliphila TaxID=369829 RepID=UPI00036E6A85